MRLMLPEFQRIREQRMRQVNKNAVDGSVNLSFCRRRTVRSRSSLFHPFLVTHVFGTFGSRSILLPEGCVKMVGKGREGRKTGR